MGNFVLFGLHLKARSSHSDNLSDSLSLSECHHLPRLFGCHSTWLWKWV